MKKFLLVLVCAVIILFFAGFNYLLWDRENKAADIKDLEYTNENKEDYINYMTDEKKMVENENESLKKQIESLENTVSDLNSQIESLKAGIRQNEADLKKSSELIELLKEQADRQMLAQKIRQYVELLNSRDYTQAYQMRYGHTLLYASKPSLTSYSTGYREKVKSMKIESLEYIEDSPGGYGEQHVFNAMLEVQLKENEDNGGCEFEPGVNNRTFILGFDETAGEWVIADILPPGS